jgi:hypothetical protein
MISRWLVPVVFISGLLTSCSDGETRWAGTISDSAGVTIVSNPEQGIWVPGEEWVVEEDPDYLFGDIMGIAVDSHGRMFVLDFHAQHVQVYSADGVYEETLGGPGEGPGELTGASDVFMGPGNTLLVQDFGALRFHRFAPDGSSVSGFRMAVEERRPNLFKGTPSGVLVEQFGLRNKENQTWLASLTSGGAVNDTLLTYSSPPVLGADGRRPFRSFYTPQMIWDSSGELDLICGTNDEYRISTYSAGSLVRIITKPFYPAPVEDSEIKGIRDLFYAWMRELQWPPEVMDERWRNVLIADTYPAFQRLAFGPRGTIWVQQIQRVSELNDLDSWATINRLWTSGARDWDVFDSEGRFLGVVTMPDRFRARLFLGEKIYGTWYDQFDLSYVVRLGVKDAAGT